VSGVARITPFTAENLQTHSTVLMLKSFSKLIEISKRFSKTQASLDNG